jgi:hypothetical protein
MSFGCSYPDGSMRLRRVLIGIAVALTALPLVPAEEGRIHLALSGDWSGMGGDGSEVSYSFAKDGVVVWRVKEKRFLDAFPEGLKAKYRVRIGKPLCEIDIYDFNDPRFKGVRFRGILEITDAQTFKLEGMPSNQGERPRKFSKEAVVFRASKK